MTQKEFETYLQEHYNFERYDVGILARRTGIDNFYVLKGYEDGKAVFTVFNGTKQEHIWSTLSETRVKSTNDVPNVDLNSEDINTELDNMLSIAFNNRV